MSDTLEELNRLFVNHGSAIKPGDSIYLRNFQVETEKNVDLLNLVRNTTEQINRDKESGGRYPLPFCNPIILIFQKLEFIAWYFQGEFEIQTSNKQLREELAGIWYHLIKGWYFGTIYIGHGDDFEEIDRQALLSKGKNPDLHLVRGKFRLYTTTSGPNNLFHSVLSGQSGLEFTIEQQSRMVKCECRGFYNWLFWWQLWAEMLPSIDRVSAAIKAISKNVVVTPKSQAEFENIKQQFDNHECFLKRTGSMDTESGGVALGKTKFEELIFMPREGPLAIFEAAHRVFEFHAAHLGYAGRFPEQKKERINAGENYPHQKVVSNVRNCLLSSLNHIFDELRAKLGPEVIPFDLKVVPANQTYAEGLPHFQHGGTFNNHPADNRFQFWQQKTWDDKTGND